MPRKKKPPPPVTCQTEKGRRPLYAGPDSHAVLVLDVKQRAAWAESRHNSHDCSAARKVFRGIHREWVVPADLSGPELRALCQSLLPLFTRICNGARDDAPGCWSAVSLNDDAMSALWSVDLVIDEVRRARYRAGTHRRAHVGTGV